MNYPDIKPAGDQESLPAIIKSRNEIATGLKALYDDLFAVQGIALSKQFFKSEFQQPITVRSH